MMISWSATSEFTSEIIHGKNKYFEWERKWKYVVMKCREKELQIASVS